MKILGTLTVDTPNALDKVTDLNADLLDGKSSELFLSRSSTTGVYIADTAIIIDNSITPTAGGGRLKIYDRDSIDTAAKGISIGKLYSDSAADITTIDADLNISLATDKDFKLFTNVTGVSSTNRLTVLANGNVGINKATPTAKLQVHVGAAETPLHPLLITAVTKTLFDVDFSGNIGINAAADSNVQLLLQGARTSTHGYSSYGIKNDLTYVAPPAAVASIYSMYIGTTIEADTTFATAAALFINPISITGGANASAKYGIYQAGAADSNVFNGATTFSNAFTLSAITNTINIGGAQTIGVLTLGGTSQTGTITLGRSTVTHTLNIDAGATTSDNTKTINIGTGGVAGSNTTITYGSSIGTTHTFNGNVGIGTSLPQAKLDLGVGSGGRRLNVFNDNINAISGFGTDIGGANYELSSYAGGNGANLGIFTWLAYNRTANTYAERMRINSTGNVLIGKTTDDVTNKLQVEGGASVSGLTVLGGLLGTVVGNSVMVSKIGAPTSNYVFNAKYVLRRRAGDNWYSAVFHDAIGVDNSYITPTVDTKCWWERDPYTQTQAWGNDASTQLMLAGGNLGIGTGTTTPTEKLHVVGNVLATGTIKGSSFTVATDAAGSRYTGIKAGEGYADGVSGATFKSITDNPNGRSFAFAAYFGGATGTNSFFVAADGTGYFKSNVGIGIDIPTEKLHVDGNILATGTVTGSNISNSYVWVFVITSTSTAYNTSDAYNASNNYVKPRTGDTVGSAFTDSATLPSFYNKNVVVYRSTTTSSYSAYEQVFPDITITTGGVCTISFAAAQTVGYVFRVIFS